MRFAWFLSAAIGFLSLSQEILWVRYASFAYQSRPQAFAYVLALFLLGIAAGAALGKRLCAATRDLYAAAGAVLIAAGALDLLALFVAVPIALSSFLLGLLAVAVFACATLKGVIFPIVHHLGSVAEEGRVGSSVSRVYFFNIVGATLGPLATGYFLLDALGLQSAMLAMGGLALALGALCAGKARRPLWAIAGAVAAALSLGGFALPELVVTSLTNEPPSLVRRVVENRSGIIHVISAPNGDEIYGGNVYDGRANVDPGINSNGIHRVFVLAALKPQASDVLMVGLGGGAWTRVVSAFPAVKRIDVVEINPGYIEIVRDYPQIRPILSDPRIRIEIDDGRRWLRRNPDTRYDLIVINATWHWRSYSTNLLSRESLSLLKRHLRPGGVLAYNATGSLDAFKTATVVFAFAFRYVNFVVAGDEDFRPRAARAEPILRSMRYDGRPIFEPGNPSHAGFIAELTGEPFAAIGQDEARAQRTGEVITDWNMIPEYRYGRPWP